MSLLQLRERPPRRQRPLRESQLLITWTTTAQTLAVFEHHTPHAGQHAGSRSTSKTLKCLRLARGRQTNSCPVSQPRTMRLWITRLVSAVLYFILPVHSQTCVFNRLKALTERLSLRLTASSAHCSAMLFCIVMHTIGVVHPFCMLN